MDAVVRAWLEPQRQVRLVWQYDIQNQATGETCVSGTVTLVPVDLNSRKILRQLPDFIQMGMKRLLGEPLP
jgi:acyl-CoA thioester hydrolase